MIADREPEGSADRTAGRPPQTAWIPRLGDQGTPEPARRPFPALRLGTARTLEFGSVKPITASLGGFA